MTGFDDGGELSAKSRHARVKRREEIAGLVHELRLEAAWQCRLADRMPDRDAHDFLAKTAWVLFELGA